jgi:hypothetical protein
MISEYFNINISSLIFEIASLFRKKLWHQVHPTNGSNFMVLITSITSTNFGTVIDSIKNIIEFLKILLSFITENFEENSLRKLY